MNEQKPKIKTRIIIGAVTIIVVLFTIYFMVNPFGMGLDLGNNAECSGLGSEYVIQNQTDTNVTCVNTENSSDLRTIQKNW